MLRDHLVTAHPERDGAFRWRGDGVSRIEGLSDAVFGFAVTLLVVSLGVPKSFDDLARMLAGFPAFVGTFFIIVIIWLAQYRFFRRYGLEDARTIRLNVVLLCLVVFFVYPLKFLFETFVAMWLGPIGALLGIDVLREQSSAAWKALDQAQWPGLMIVFAIGYFAIFGVFARMHRHALDCADALELDEVERFETRLTIVEHRVSMGIAVASVAITLLVSYGLGLPARFGARMGGAPSLGALAGGMLYPFTGAIIALVLRPHRRRRAELLAARASRVPA